MSEWSKQAIARLEETAERVPEPTRSRLEAIVSACEGRTPAEQDELLREALSALWTEMAPTAVGLYGVLSSYLARQTGMTVEDYVWLRDYERKLND
jgi:hypothetical protein